MSEKSNKKYQLKFKDAVDACKWNIEQYIKDIKLLLDSESYGHAYALSVICLEEISKLYIFFDVSTGQISKEFYKKNHKMVRNHEAKLKDCLYREINRIIKEKVHSELMAEIPNIKELSSEERLVVV